MTGLRTAHWRRPRYAVFWPGEGEGGCVGDRLGRAGRAGRLLYPTPAGQMRASWHRSSAVRIRRGDDEGGLFQQQSEGRGGQCCLTFDVELLRAQRHPCPGPTAVAIAGARLGKPCPCWPRRDRSPSSRPSAAIRRN